MAAYYNEIDPYAAQWLRNLIKGGHIAPGDVDERSIEDVHPDDLRPYTQCHFFAGIGAWSLSLRRAGWPDSRPVWTGSCPCQPFSSAGQGAGFDDERHLWPDFHWLIRERRPVLVFGEQVASKDADPWVDLVQADLEAMGYAFGAVPFPAAGVGSPNIRDRLYWVADSRGARFTEQLRIGDERQPTCGPGLAALRGADSHGSAGPVNGLWTDADWLFCRDGKWRPVEPGTFPLADGAASRVGRLRAYGNAINAEAAAQFIGAYLDATA
ncbi:DNA cytosine methyltransferase [Pseudomonas sp. F(2018)]|uniref:DNA cytosine methyltransferase n=1 Tax=Pseudomonas sp. F(2018) TaxID=2502240 RepID=UPI0010F685B0|nr:DNA cytosine methyltransferase [Pseudomonas sp. F(2018)]